jgi:hypothetical protein
VQEGKASVARELLDDRVFFVRETDMIERAQLMLLNNSLEELLVVDGAEQRVVGILTMAAVRALCSPVANSICRSSWSMESSSARASSTGNSSSLTGTTVMLSTSPPKASSRMLAGKTHAGSTGKATRPRPDNVSAAVRVTCARSLKTVAEVIDSVSTPDEKHRRSRGLRPALASRERAQPPQAALRLVAPPGTYLADAGMGMRPSRPNPQPHASCCCVKFSTEQDSP